MSEANDPLHGERGRLFVLAYRMLGSVGDAEDIVQEAYLRWHAQPRPEVREPKAYLTTIVTRLCLDHLKSASNRLETYPGVWLPEPLPEGYGEDLAGPVAAQASPEADVELLESVSLAFLALLQTLNPLERAVYLLSEVFDYSHAEIASILARTPEACRQALHRARQSLATRSRSDPPSKRHEQLLDTFIRATRRGDLDELTRLLTEDVESRADGGGIVAASRRPVRGLRAVARLYGGLARIIPTDLWVRLEAIHGWPTALMGRGEDLLSVLQVRVRGDRICRIDNVLNPHKLRRIAHAFGLTTSA